MNLSVSREHSDNISSEFGVPNDRKYAYPHSCNTTPCHSLGFNLRAQWAATISLFLFSFTVLKVSLKGFEIWQKYCFSTSRIKGTVVQHFRFSFRGIFVSGSLNNKTLDFSAIENNSSQDLLLLSGDDQLQCAEDSVVFKERSFGKKEKQKRGGVYWGKGGGGRGRVLGLEVGA